MKLLRTLFSVLFSLALVVGLLPSASVFASSNVPSWGDPNVVYGTKFSAAIGNFTQSGLAFGESRPVKLYRWQAVFTDFTTGQVTSALDRYDVFNLLNQQPGDNFDFGSGYGLLPWDAKDKIAEFVRMANGNPDYVVSFLNDVLSNWQVFDPQDLLSLFYGVKPNDSDNMSLYVRSLMLVYLSGGTLDRTDGASTGDPGQINGTAYFLTSPWPKINQAVVQGDTVHIDVNLWH